MPDSTHPALGNRLDTARIALESAREINEELSNHA